MFWNKIFVALGLSRSIEEIKRQDPFFQMIASVDRQVHSIFAQMQADAIFKERKDAEEMEKLHPGIPKRTKQTALTLWITSDLDHHSPSPAHRKTPYFHLCRGFSVFIEVVIFDRFTSMPP